MLEVVISPDPVLREVSLPCDLKDKSLKKLAKQMAKLMYKSNGVGLAAPQVGELKRIIVIDCDVESEKANPITLINPEIVELKGEPESGQEGCLSCPGIYIPIMRQPYARVKYYDLDGNECEIAGDGLLGRCLQHEIDHLDGKTLFESCTPGVRLKALALYQSALEKGAKPGDTFAVVEE